MSSSKLKIKKDIELYLEDLVYAASTVSDLAPYLYDKDALRRMLLLNDMIKIKGLVQNVLNGMED